MTAALTDVDPPSDGWTTDDLDRLPEDGRRRELIDGVLFVSPSPSNIYQTIALLLGGALIETAPGEYDVTQGVEVRINPRRSLIPDVLVTTAEAADRGPHWFAPHEGALAVHTYQIDPAAEVYRATGVHTDIVETDQPWPLAFKVDRIRPRRLR